MLTALSTYLQAQLAALGALANSQLVDEWPEPTQDLTLSTTKVVVAVTRAGKPDVDDRIGGPNVQKVTLGTSPLGTVRYEYGSIEQPIAIGLWAQTRALRDDVDLFIQGLLNVPYWTTVSPVASTTLLTAITKTGLQLVKPAAMTDIWPGILVDVNTGSLKERLLVREIRADGFKASPTKLHNAGVGIVEVAGMRETTGEDLYLRCPNHYNNIAHFQFEDSPQTMDDAEGGRGSQRQEWRSIRNGIGSIRWSRDIAAVVLQKTAAISLSASFVGGPVATPKIITSF